MLFSIIAYLPSESYFCRGCLVDGRDSRQEIIQDLNEDQLVESWAAFISEDDWEITVIPQVGDSGEHNFEDDFMQKISDKAEELTKARNKREEDAKRKKKLDNQAKYEKEEREELERLQKKYKQP